MYYKVLQSIAQYHSVLQSTTRYFSVDRTAEDRRTPKVRFDHRTGWWPSTHSIGKFFHLAYRFSSTWNFGPRPGTTCTIYHTMYKHIQMINNTSFWVPRMLGPWPVAAQDQEQLSKTHGAARRFTNERCNFFWKIALHLLTLGSIHRPNGQMICRAVSTGLILEHALLWGV